jgi:dihydrofolate reductase
MRGMIAAVSPEGVIGLRGQIPWSHPGDMRRFQRVTRGCTVVMGRLTWESMGRKPLPRRRNVVVSSQVIEGAESFRDIEKALAAVEADTNPVDVWFIGGARIYEEAMAFCDVIDLTYVPDKVADPDAVKFPSIDPRLYVAGPLLPHEDEPGLARRVFTRRTSRAA